MDFYKPYIILYILPFCASLLSIQHAQASTCSINDRPCIIENLEETAATIENKSWRDQTYRELAKTLAFDGKNKEAIALIDKIETPDTKAMTIRGIGMAIAESKQSREKYLETFIALRAKAEKITHPPSYAIALTYIAMAQAFAEDNEGAWKTASDMKNDALRHKAYGETAEIQAEKGNFEAAMKSIGFIESEAFRNKAYAIVSKIFTETKNEDEVPIYLEEALGAAEAISNPYKKAKAIQNILDTQKPREMPH